MRKAIRILDRVLGVVVGRWVWVLERKALDTFPLVLVALVLLALLIPVALLYIGVSEVRRRIDEKEYWEQAETLAAMDPETFGNEDKPELGSRR